MDANGQSKYEKVGGKSSLLDMATHIEPSKQKALKILLMHALSALFKSGDPEALKQHVGKFFEDYFKLASDRIDSDSIECYKNDLLEMMEEHSTDELARIICYLMEDEGLAEATHTTTPAIWFPFGVRSHHKADEISQIWAVVWKIERIMKYFTVKISHMY